MMCLRWAVTESVNRISDRLSCLPWKFNAKHNVVGREMPMRPWCLPKQRAIEPFSRNEPSRPLSDAEKQLTMRMQFDEAFFQSMDMRQVAFLLSKIDAQEANQSPKIAAHLVRLRTLSAELRNKELQLVHQHAARCMKSAHHVL